MNPIVVTLPWPPDLALLPRARKLARALHKSKCANATLLVTHGRPVADVPLRLELVFHGPSGEQDRAELLARMQAGIVGIASALRVDARRFVEITARLGEPVESRSQANVQLTIAPAVEILVCGKGAYIQPATAAALREVGQAVLGAAAHNETKSIAGTSPAPTKPATT